MLKQDAERLRQQIANLYLQFPELVGDDEMLRVDTLEGATNIKELLTAILRATEDAKALRDGTEQRLEELKARQTRFKMRIEFLRAMILQILHQADLRKIELPEGTLSIRAGTPQIVGDLDPDKLPDEFCRIMREVDRAKIRTALLNGQQVPGYFLSNSEPVLAVHVR